MMENRMENSDRKIALLIDGDNARPALIEKILAEAGRYGSVTIRRIYGDWTEADMRGWKVVLNNYAVQPMQQFRYTIGKNATDSAMIIDAMDILHNHLVDSFCLVSSDSDYTRLATRIREKGTFVMGIGEQKTPKAFVNACNIFIYTQNLMPKKEIVKERPAAKKPDVKDDISKKAVPVPLLKQAFEMAAQEDGWANLATMGFNLHRLDPGFDPRTYGYGRLSQLIKAHPKVFELRNPDKSGPSSIYIRIKE